MKQANTQLAEAITNPALGGSIQDMGGVEWLQLMLPNFITLALIVGIVLFVFIMFVGAIQWITSGGDKTAVEGARGKISNAVVGIVLLLATFAIISIIELFFGVDILSLDFDDLMIK